MLSNKHWKWHTAKYGDPYSEFMLCIYPSKCTHTAVNTHPEQWAAVAPGEQLGVRCLAQGHLIVVLKVERERIHSPHRQSLPDQDSNSQPFDYESKSLTITPQLPHCWMKCNIFAAGKIKPFFVPSHKMYLLQATVFYSALKRQQPQDKKTLSDLPVLRAFLLLCSKHIL